MMSVPENLRYTAQHEWVSVDGGIATVGITDYAQRQLGDVVYVSVPAAGGQVTAGEPCGEVESTKAVSDVWAPANGEVTDVNGDVDDDPGLVNSDPYGAGWLMRITTPATRRHIRCRQGRCSRPRWPRSRRDPGRRAAPQRSAPG